MDGARKPLRYSDADDDGFGVKGREGRLETFVKEQPDERRILWGTASAKPSKATDASRISETAADRVACQFDTSVKIDWRAMLCKEPFVTVSPSTFDLMGAKARSPGGN